MRLLAISSRLLLLSVILALGMGVLAAWQMIQAREAELRRAEVTGSNLLFAVSFVLERTLVRADRAITDTVAQLDGDNAAYAIVALSDDHLFHMQPDDALGVLVVTDDQGRVVRSTRPMISEATDLSDRDFFAIHRDNEDTGLFISHPFMSRQDGRASVALSRRWQDIDGRFGGTVVHTVKLDVLQAMFEAINLGPGSSMSLFLDDGTLLMRVPHQPELLGISMAGTPGFERFMRSGEGQHIGTASPDGVRRLYNSRRIDGYPLLVNSAQSVEAILGNWYTSMRWQALVTVLLMLAILGVAGMAQRELTAHRKVSARLRRVEHELRTIMDNTPALIAHWDRHLYNRFANRAHEHWLGKAGTSLAGRHLSAMLGEKSLQSVSKYIDAALAGTPQTYEMSFRDRNGSLRQAICNLVPDRSGDGQIDGFFALVQDITDYKQVEERLADETERFRVTLESIRDAVITTDGNGRITYLNPAASGLTGWSQDAAAGLPVADVVRLAWPVDEPRQPGERPFPVADVLADGDAAVPKRRVVLHAGDDKQVDAEVSATRIVDRDGVLIGSVMVLHDVTQARSQAARMAHLALHDSLTGLPNRRFLDEMAAQSIAAARRENRQLAVLFLDIDGFKHVNDTLGHAAGDALLVETAHHWRSQLRGGDILARVGGDEFVVLMNHVDNRDDAAQLAQRILSPEAALPEFSNATLVSTSVGIALWPDHAVEFDALVACADQAMYQAKLMGSNQYRFFGD
ncbi:MAG: diguanylate cyclase [Castellaniella sp.]